MAKKRNRDQQEKPTVRRTPAYPIPLPEIASRDALAMMADDELAKRMDALRADAEFVAGHSTELSVHPWEVEMAYTHRELGSRINRRQLHERYTAQRGAR